VIKLNGVTAIAAAFCIQVSACVKSQVEDCTVTSENIIIEEMLEITKPRIEFLRSDGTKYSMDSFLTLNNLEVAECGSRYRVKFYPKKLLSDGSTVIGPRRTLYIDKRSKQIVADYVDGGE